MPEKPTRWTGLPVSAEMMLRVLDLSKGMTRRVMNPQPPPETVAMYQLGTYYRDGWVAEQPDGSVVSRREGIQYCDGWQPRYKVGSGAYFREPLFRVGRFSFYRADRTPCEVDDMGYLWEWKNSGIPGRYCPRRLSRACAPITEARPELLTDITEEDCRAEGIRARGALNFFNGVDGYPWNTARDSFKVLWDSLHARDGKTWQGALDGKWPGWVWVYAWDPPTIGWAETQEKIS